MNIDGYIHVDRTKHPVTKVGMWTFGNLESELVMEVIASHCYLDASKEMEIHNANKQDTTL